MMIGGGEGGGEHQRKIWGGHKEHKALQELVVPEKFKWVPETVRSAGPAYEIGQLWVKFAEAIRTGANVEPDFEHALRRHRTLDAIVGASETGQRQKVPL
jgi:predicted dehydrogenase